MIVFGLWVWTIIIWLFLVIGLPIAKLFGLTDVSWSVAFLPITLPFYIGLAALIIVGIPNIILLLLLMFI